MLAKLRPPSRAARGTLQSITDGDEAPLCRNIMLYVVGTDEAGYGPNLGPLVIAATVWQIDDPAKAHDLYRVLRKVICNDAAKATAQKIAMADSKALYSPDRGLHDLERGVLAALCCLGYEPACWRSLWRFLDAAVEHDGDDQAWHLDYELTLPLAIELKKLTKTVEVLRAGLEAAGVRLLAIKTRVIFPQRFNDLTEFYDNKAELLSRTTLELLNHAIAVLPEAPVIAFCDKHGGRNHYAPLLQQQFPDWLVEVHAEGCEESIYRFGPAERRVEVGFRVRSEKFLPAALASMTAKYLREVFMRPFNDFWCARIPGLRPTAGYPFDSHRFRRDIKETQLALGIADRVLWRNR